MKKLNKNQQAVYAVITNQKYNKEEIIQALSINIDTDKQLLAALNVIKNVIIRIAYEDYFDSILNKMNKEYADRNSITEIHISNKIQLKHEIYANANLIRTYEPLSEAGKKYNINHIVIKMLLETDFLGFVVNEWQYYIKNKYVFDLDAVQYKLGQHGIKSEIVEDIIVVVVNKHSNVAGNILAELELSIDDVIDENDIIVEITNWGEIQKINMYENQGVYSYINEYNLFKYFFGLSV